MTTPVQHSRTSSDRLRQSRAAGWLFVCVNAIYFFTYFHRVAIPGTIFDELQSAFHAPASAIALVGTIYLYIYGGMQLFVGIMNDRLGALRVALLGGVLLAAGGIVFPLASTLTDLYAARALVGLGSSLIFISVVKTVDMLYGARAFAAMLGLAMTIGCAGGLMGTFPFERAVHLWGWRPSLLALGILCAVAVLVTAALVIGTGQVAPPTAPPPLAVGTILRNRHNWPMLFGVPLNFAVYFLLQAIIGKKFLLDHGHLPSALAASFTFIMMLSSMAIIFAGSFLLRFTGHRRKPLMHIALGCSVVGTLLLLLFLRINADGGWFLAAYVLLALSNLSSPIGNTMMKELNPPEALGTAIGALNSASYLSVALLASLAGLIMDRFRATAHVTATAILYPPAAYQTIFLLCLLLTIIAFASTFGLRETGGE